MTATGCSIQYPGCPKNRGVAMKAGIKADLSSHILSI
jgi:hypothetical protein